MCANAAISVAVLENPVFISYLFLWQKASQTAE
jgi:hypothetical protein